MNTNPFNVIIKPSGARCNLACEYCFYLKKERLYPQSDFSMPLETLEVFISRYLESQPEGEIIFTWQGGEPTLLDIPFYEHALEFQEKFKRPSQTILNTFQTNGILLNDDWGRFLADHHFLVGLSLDGSKDYHDAFRKTRTGDGTHSLALAGLDILKKYQVETNILACISAANIKDPLGVYRYFRDDLQMPYIQFIPIVERINASGNQKGERLSPRSISGKEFGRFMIAIFDEWVHHDVSKVFVQLFETCLGIWMGYQPSLCIFSEACGACLALEHNGDLYSCDHYVQPDTRLGNIHFSSLGNLAASNQQIVFGKNKKSLLPKKCLKCEVRFICNGDCPKNRILPAVKGDHPISHLCEGYYEFFTYIEKPMKFMASLYKAGKPFGEIMKNMGQGLT
jgi:uncharacterized protein